MLVGLLNFFNKCSCRNLCLSWTYLIEFGLESFGSTYQSVRATSLGPRSFANGRSSEKTEMAVWNLI